MTEESTIAPDLYRASAMDAELVQFLDYRDWNSNARGLILNFRRLKLERIADHKLIFEGAIILRLNGGITPAGLTVFDRLLHGFKGWFLIGFTGGYKIHKHHAEVTITNTPSVNLQPFNPKGGDRLVDPATGEVLD